MVILEAQACGLPVLVTDVGGPKELVVEGETGFILSLDEPEAWVEQILELMRNADSQPETFERFRTRIQARINQQFTIDAALFDVLDVEPGRIPLDDDVPTLSVGHSGDGVLEVA